MKALLFILCFAASLLPAMSQITKEDLRKTLQHQIALSREQQAEIDATAAEKGILVERLNRTESQLADVGGRLVWAQKEIDDRAKADAEKISAANARTVKVEAANAVLSARLNKAAWWVALALAIAAFAFVWKWSPQLGNPVTTYGVYAAVPVLVFGAVFSFVRYFL